MGFLAKFHNVYTKKTPKFLQAMIRPFWRMLFIIPKGLVNSRLCGKMLVSWKRVSFVYKTLDYVRHSSLELIAKEIYDNNIRGAVAELGVYQGHFAKYINQILPDKKLYLFDTFEGFNENDLQIEKSNGLNHPEYDFKNTNVNYVLKKMRYKENCIIKKRFFPGNSKWNK
jgi:O-methyltransferase